jgi:two-component system CheB/CheR fusion protein
VDDLPGRIIAYLQRTPLVTLPKLTLEDKTQSALEKAIILLRTHTGHDFSLYKKNTFYRRIERRMGIHQIEKIADYVRYLQENSQELDLLFKELLIGVTSFFRDPPRGRSCAKKSFRRSSPAGRPAMCCGRGCPAAPPGRRRIRWPWSSRR